MARERRRLLIPATRLAQTASGTDPQTPGALLTLDPAERHYLQRVLRQRQGDQVALVDGQGGLWTARLEEGARLRLEQPLAAPLRRDPAPSPPLELALALPRRDVELVWRMATELGIDRFRPLRAARCVVAGQPPLERWNSVITEACEQCERLWRPELLDPVEALPWLAEAPAQARELQGLGSQRLELQSGGPEGGEAQDGTPQDGRAPVAPSATACRLFTTTRDGSLPSLASVLADQHPHGAALTVAIGPEGGWSDQEQTAALAAGWRAVSLGPLILRSGTAAVAAATLLATWRQGAAPQQGRPPRGAPPDPGPIRT
ncbi:MAG: RsmE family RNA methyltransferase [Cyanobium sp.]